MGNRSRSAPVASARSLRKRSTAWTDSRSHYIWPDRFVGGSTAPAPMPNAGNQSPNAPMGRELTRRAGIRFSEQRNGTACTLQCSRTIQSGNMRERPRNRHFLQYHTHGGHHIACGNPARRLFRRGPNANFAVGGTACTNASSLPGGRTQQSEVPCLVSIPHRIKRTGRKAQN